VEKQEKKNSSNQLKTVNDNIRGRKERTSENES
jgi:hypothetical protein